VVRPIAMDLAWGCGMGCWPPLCHRIWLRASPIAWSSPMSSPDLPDLAVVTVAAREEDVAPPAALPSWSLTVRPMCHRICPSRRRDGFSGQPWLPHVAAQICPLVTVGIVLAARRRLARCFGPKWGRRRPFTTLPSPSDGRKMGS
ncbi:hypothetical protein ACLOJK_008047, partial [Asimina triloba]